MTNVDCILVWWISHSLVYLVVNWWRRPLQAHVPHPRHIHTLCPVCLSPLPKQPEADSRLMAGRPTGHVADAVLPPHGSTVCHLHLQAWWIKQSFGRSDEDVSAVQMVAHGKSLTYSTWCIFILFELLSFLNIQYTLSTPVFLPLISLVNLTRCESVSGRGCSSILWMSNTSHMNWMTGWAL